MKKIIITLLLISSGLFGSYQKALTLYDKKEYSQSLQELKISYDEYGEKKLHQLWAKVAQMLGDKNMMMSAYERVLMIDDEDNNVKFMLYTIYKQTKREQLASQMLQTLQSSPTLNSKQQKVLKSFSKKERVQSNFIANIAFGYDNNINNRFSNDIAQEYQVVNSESAKGSGFSRISTKYNLEYKFDTPYYLNGGLELYYQYNFNATKYNLFVGNIELGAGYEEGRYNFYFPIYYSTIHYINNNFLSQIALKPKVTYALNEEVTLFLQPTYSKKDYLMSAYNSLDGYVYGLWSGAKYRTSKIAYNFVAGYQNYNTQKKSLSMKGSILYPIIYKAVVGVEYKYKKDWYNEKLSSSKRADNLHQLKVDLRYALSKNYQISFSDKYVRNSSNYALAKYNKNVVMIGFNYNY